MSRRLKNHCDNQRLDRDYTVFADVVSVMEVVDGIMEGDVIQSIAEEPAGSGR